MAIEKITFTNGSTKADQYSDMLSFLQTYATPYFDSITGDSETGVISCRLAGRSYDSLTLYCNSSSNLVSFKWYTQESGTTNDGITYTGSSYKFSYAVVTSKGFYICWFVNTSKPKQPSFFVITKDNKNGIFGVGCNDSNLNAFDLSTRHGTDTAIYSGFATGKIYSYLSYNTSYTYLTPFIDKGATEVNTIVSKRYTPFCFLLLCYEFAFLTDIEGKLAFDDKNYYTNGYIALED